MTTSASEQDTTRCVVCTKPRTAHVGLLCIGHRERLGQMLREIEDQAAILSAVPSMAIRQGTSGTLASERSPAVLDAIVATDPRRGLMRWSSDTFDPWGLDDTRSVLETLHSIARTIREDRYLTPPETVTISGERDFLSRQLDWLSARPDIDERYAEIRELLAQLQDTNKTRPDRPAGRCYLPTDTGTCGGVIRRSPVSSQPWIPLPDRCVRTEVETTDGHAYCDRCGETWDGPQLAMLSFELEQAKREAARPRTDDGRKMLTAQEVADKLGVSVNAVRIMASRRRLVSVDGHYDPRAFADRMAG